ncbi:hypothetical protein ACQ5SO_20790 [Rhodovulum sp. DZ06]|uniref:hypothetical protein n=1 Tax=Rhodovulum sp. DZ06 TaxID=3425126 RepID=UPI003D34922C
MVALTFFTADEDPSPNETARKAPTPEPGGAAAPKVAAATPQAAGDGGIYSSPSISTPGMGAPGGADDVASMGGRGAGAPVSRLNGDALAALDRADPSGFAGAQASAPRPSAARQLDPAAPVAVPEGDIARPTASRLAALQHGGGLGASGGHALAAVANIALPEQRRAPGAISPVAPMGGDATAGLSAPSGAGLNLPASPAAPAAPGDRMAALSPGMSGPGALGAPAVPGGVLNAPNIGGPRAPVLGGGPAAPSLGAPSIGGPRPPVLGGEPSMTAPGAARPSSRLSGPDLRRALPMPGVGAPAPSGPSRPADDEDGPQAVFVPGVGVIVPDTPADENAPAAEGGDAPADGLVFKAPESTAPAAPALSAAPGLALAGPSMPTAPAFSAPSIGRGPAIRTESIPGLRAATEAMPAPGGVAPIAPAPAQRVATLSPATTSVAPVRAFDAAPSGLGLQSAPRPTAPDAGVSRGAVAPEAPEDAAEDMDLRAAVLRDAGVPLPRPRPAQVETATPVTRVDVAAVPVLRKGSVPVRRVGSATQAGAGAREASVAAPGATPVTPIARRTGDVAAAGGPTATAPRVLGPGRLDDRRASSLVAAISTRPDSRVTRPNVYAAPGLQSEGRQAAGFNGAQASAARPTIGGPASLGGAAPNFGGTDTAALGLRGGNTSQVVRYGGGGMAQPRMAGLPTIGGAAPSIPGRSASPSLPQVGVDLSPTTPGAPAPAPAAAPQGPRVAVVLHGVDPVLAIDPQGLLAPMYAVGAPVTLVAPVGYAPDADTVAALRANGVELVLQAASRAEVRASARAGAVAVQPISDGTPMSMSSMRRFLKEAKEQNLAIFSPATGIGAAGRMAENMGLAVVRSLQFVEIRSIANLRVLHASLDQAAFQARNSGQGAALELWGSPEAIQAAAEWFGAVHAGTAMPSAISALEQR